MYSMFSQESPFSDYEVGEQKLGEVKLVCWMPVESMKIGVWKVAMSDRIFDIKWGTHEPRGHIPISLQLTLVLTNWFHRV